MGSNHIQDILTELAHMRDLSAGEAERAFHIIMTGGATPAQIAAFLMGLRIKGETVVEITAGAEVLRHKALTFTAPEGAIDTCGTGGDGKRSYNISTAVAIVVAACGVAVVKHGNRSVTSASGSSDVLQQLGVNIAASPEVQQRALRETNLCFLMAPLYHHAMRHVASVRQELGLRTIFNLLGPLANPARTRFQLLGVYDRQWLTPMAETLRALGVQRAWVVHGEDGMDELTTTTISYVAALEQDGNIRHFTLNPTDYGIPFAAPEALRGGLPEDNAHALQDVLNGKHGAYRDIVMLNAAAALVVAGKAQDIQQGIAYAAEAVDSGKARSILAQYSEMTRAE
jgi:anthranilate phosphoribosyltransferase